MLWQYRRCMASSRSSPARKPPAQRRSKSSRTPSREPRERNESDENAARAAGAQVRYVAFLRGVSPMNAKMPALKAAFEAGGFSDVKTVLSSGNVLFSAPRVRLAELERALESTMQRALGRSFVTFVRTVDELRELIAHDPWRGLPVARAAKRVVSFLRSPAPASIRLPIEQDGATVYAIRGREVFTAYVPNPQRVVFMSLLENTFGSEITTRTWDTVLKVAK